MTFISKTQNAKKDEIYCMSIVLQKKKNDDSKKKKKSLMAPICPRNQSPNTSPPPTPAPDATISNHFYSSFSLHASYTLLSWKHTLGFPLYQAVSLWNILFYKIGR